MRLTFGVAARTARQRSVDAGKEYPDVLADITVLPTDESCNTFASLIAIAELVTLQCGGSSQVETKLSQRLQWIGLLYHKWSLEGVFCAIGTLQYCKGAGYIQQRMLAVKPLSSTRIHLRA